MATNGTDNDEDEWDDEAPNINPYDVLDLKKDASEKEIKSAYRKAALKHHPGRFALVVGMLAILTPRRQNTRASQICSSYQVSVNSISLRGLV
jgi:DnaJ-class molecular chaperone